MPHYKTSRPGEMLPAAHVRQRYAISDMTLWRWEKDPKLDFPSRSASTAAATGA